MATSSAAVADAFDRWDVLELAADPRGWRSELEEWSAAHGDRVVEFNTAWTSRMAPATDRAWQLVTSGGMTHDGSEVIARHIGNAVVKSTPMGASLQKDKRGSARKIDAAVAAIVALDRAAHHRLLVVGDEPTSGPRPWDVDQVALWELGLGRERVLSAEGRDDALSKAQRLLANGASAEDVLAQLARGLTNKLLHAPSVQLKKLSAEGRVEALSMAQELFALHEGTEKT